MTLKFEPTFIILVLICRIKTNHQTFDMQQASQSTVFLLNGYLSLLHFCLEHIHPKDDYAEFGNEIHACILAFLA